ncbi:MAG: hypothetical protein R8K46_09060 [Mariprofundaceae bacterium]
MRILALIAFVALQLSMFACEGDVHVHGMDGEASHMVQHQDGPDGHDDGLLVDHACQLHASHVFLDQGICGLDRVRAHPEQVFSLASASFFNFPHLIERPPKYSHG